MALTAAACESNPPVRVIARDVLDVAAADDAATDDTGLEDLANTDDSTPDDATRDAAGELARDDAPTAADVTATDVTAPDVTAPDDAPPASCRDDRDCATSPAGRVCDPSAGRCVPCTAARPEACGTGRYCTTDHRCAPGCGGDGDCAAVPFATTACVRNACVFACVDDRGDCDGDPDNGCETSLTSPRACGRCGNACAGDTPVCVDGDGEARCGTGCSAAQSRCAMSCVDTRAAIDHCGGCGRACASATNAGPTCVDGRCGFACATGFGDCDGNATNGCETTLATSATDCGACGTLCVSPHGARGACVGGRCGYTCLAGSADCNGDPADGCEADLRIAVAHCGRCGARCPAPPNAAPTCASGACGFVCLDGYADCNGDPADGCEVDLRASASHCGRCGAACMPGGACVASTCRAAQSCTDVLRASPGAPSGPFTVDPDGDGPGAPLRLYCDLETDGGGWTLVHKTNQSSTGDRTDDGFNVAGLASAELDGVAVLPRRTLAMLTGVTRVLSADRSRRIYFRGLDYYTTDDHRVASGARDLEVTTDLARGMSPGEAVFDALYGPCVAAGAWPDASSAAQHVCTQRYCCGAPNAGLWWNRGPWSPGSYTGGTAWVRACAAGRGDCDLTARDGCETDLTTSAANCGACGRACAPGVSCMAGVCRYPRSCADLLAAAPDTVSGAYTLDADGDGPLAPMRLACDMTGQGGGWTLVHKTDRSSAGDRTDAGFQPWFLASPEVDAVAILPRAVISRLGTTYRVQNADRTRRMFFRGVDWYTTDAHATSGMSDITATLDLARGFSPGAAVFTAMQGLCVAAGAWPDASGATQYVCASRFCCGTPNYGLWWDNGPWSPGDYTAGTVWVR